eukprot:3005014-Heterocapsa_arctica.AAC.1
MVCNVFEWFLNGSTPPEANLELAGAIESSLRPGAVVGADGGRAILSCVRSAARKHGGSTANIPIASATHGKQPVKQFTRLVLVSKDEVPSELAAVLKSQNRWDEASGTVRFTGGNQSAESEWGTSNQLLKQKAAHRGKAKLHSTAHGCSALFLSTSPGLQHLGCAMKVFYASTMDKADPTKYFSRSGWSAVGADENDLDAHRICVTKRAVEVDRVMDESIKAQTQKRSARKRPAATNSPWRAARKKPAAAAAPKSITYC